MVRKAENNKIKGHKGAIEIHQQRIEDDNLLPAADELEKLNSINPDLIQWIMDRTEKEQDARIRFNEDRMKLAQGDFKHTHRFNYCALIMAFVIVMSFLGLSFYLICNNYETIGTIFAGGTIVLIISYFLKVPRNKHQSD